MINKSMNASKNLPKPLTKASEGPHWIRMLAAELAIRLNEARENTPGLWPRTLSLHVRQGWNILRSKQRPFLPPRSNVTVDIMTKEAEKLWKEIVRHDMPWDGKKGMKVTHLNLSLTGIGWTEEGQKSIQGFLQAKARPDSKRAVSEDFAGPSSISNEVDVVHERGRSASPSKEGCDGTVALDPKKGKRSLVWSQGT